MLFEEQITRWPNKYPWTVDFIAAMNHGKWSSDEFDFQSDKHDYLTNLKPAEQNVIKNTLAAIAQIEVAVKEFWAKLGDNLPHPGIRDLGYIMAGIEVIHNDAYEKLLKILELKDVFEENMKLPIISGRAQYLRKHNHRYYKDSKKQYVYAIILFTLYVENVSLFSQFYIINWFNRYRNVLKDTAQQVAYTAKEENLHALAGVKIINTLRQEYPELFDDELEEKILTEAKEAFLAESKIIDWMLGDFEDDGINSDILKEFIAYRLNSSLKQIGYPPLFEIEEAVVAKTTWFDEDVLGNTRTDFFHKRPVEYAKGNKTYNEDDLF